MLNDQDWVAAIEATKRWKDEWGLAAVGRRGTRDDLKQRCMDSG